MGNRNRDTVLAGAVAQLDRIESNQRKMMATLQQILDDVTAEKTSIASVSTLFAGLKQQLADALAKLAAAGTTIPPDVQTQIDNVFAQVESNKASLATALTANVPAP